MSLFEGSPNDTQRQIHRYRSTQVGSLCSSVYLMYGPIVAAALSKFGPSSNLFWSLNRDHVLFCRLSGCFNECRYPRLPCPHAVRFHNPLLLKLWSFCGHRQSTHPPTLPTLPSRSCPLPHLPLLLLRPPAARPPGRHPHRVDRRRAKTVPGVSRSGDWSPDDGWRCLSPLLQWIIEIFTKISTIIIMIIILMIIILMIIRC